MILALVEAARNTKNVAVQISNAKARSLDGAVLLLMGDR